MSFLTLCSRYVQFFSRQTLKGFPRNHESRWHWAPANQQQPGARCRSGPLTGLCKRGRSQQAYAAQVSQVEVKELSLRPEIQVSDDGNPFKVSPSPSLHAFTSSASLIGTIVQTCPVKLLNGKHHPIETQTDFLNMNHHALHTSQVGHLEARRCSQLLETRH